MLSVFFIVFNLRTILGYNDDNWLAAITTTSDRDGLVAGFAYTYDAAGNRISMSDHGHVTTYQYDNIYQLTGVDYPADWLNDCGTTGVSRR